MNEEKIFAGSNTNGLHPVMICKKEKSCVLEATDTPARSLYLLWWPNGVCCIAKNKSQLPSPQNWLWWEGELPHSGGGVPRPTDSGKDWLTPTPGLAVEPTLFLIFPLGTGLKPVPSGDSLPSFLLAHPTFLIPLSSECSSQPVLFPTSVSVLRKQPDTSL